MTDFVDQNIDDYNEIRTSRGLWENFWQSLGELYLPNTAEFTREINKGEDLTSGIFDSTPMQARRDLASSIDGLLKSKSRRWFVGSTGDDDLDKLQEVEIWLEDTAERLFKAIYNPKARFIKRTSEVDNELVTYGTGILFIGKSDNHLLFQSMPLSRSYIRENGDGVIDTLYIRHPLTARQAAQRYGEENLGQDTRDALNDKEAKKDKKFDFIQIVKPRENRDTSKSDNKNMPWADIIIDLSSRHLVKEEGFQEFPFAVPRWDTSSSELYARSPAMIAYGDGLTLQAQGETLLTAGQKAVSPPLLVADDSIYGDIRSFPDGITYFDAEAVRETGQSPVTPLFTGADIPLGREMLEDSRDLVWQAFFRDILRLPVGGPQMTAFEVAERREEFIRTVGPVFGSLEEDYTSALVDRAFSIMQREDGFLEPPEVLKNKEVKWITRSPVERARKQIEAVAITRSVEMLTPFIEFQPDLMDNFDGDKIARDTDDIFGYPAKWLRPEEEVLGIRDGRAQQAAAQQAKEDVALAAQTAKTGAESEVIEGQFEEVS